jgi:membrane-associated protease RseP (regulator of RpoE activity)
VKRFTPLHVILFVVTMCTTLVAGMIQKGINPLAEPGRFYQGLPFALTLMTILMTHELAHFFAAMGHNTEATLPYFIPAPSIIGTFGAFIKMKSPILTRTALIDIGASGPIAGFLVSLVASVAGLMYSDVVPTPPDGAGMALGDSLLFWAVTKIIFGNVPKGFDVLLNPVAFAGWIGLFITAMNLMPIGQLDGGHVAYAVGGAKTNGLSKVLVAALIALGIFFWPGWLVWALFLTVMGSFSHPPVYYWETPLPTSRRRVAMVSLVIFIITFMPMPFSVDL